MSISKQQAAALAEGFLDNIGSENDLQFRETFTDIILMAAEFIEDAQNNLIKANNISSGALSESLQASEPAVNGNVFSIDVFMNFYGKFINSGVKGTRSGSSKAGYSFRNEIVSKKMFTAIYEWIKRAHISTQTVKQYAPHGRHETRRITISEIDSAYGKARSIKMYGIPANGFLDNAVQTTAQKVKDRLGLALKIDIINSLTR
jgi:hypothetical protein